ncbi:MAG: glycoside hydrolase family 38 C-terminal domain-containing protein [Acidimicrobiia bacterium]
MATRVAIVPHTHWDREWYAPFQVFRLRLVRLLDELLPMLDRDARYAHFMLDGQTAVVDDYLDIRPEREGQLRRLLAEGRLSIGPWMILMDEFMVSGETIVRDLQRGIRRATELGGLMEVGYLPDMFGHVAQMPQLLRLAGLSHCAVWRGVPSAVTQTAFWWEAPDGSRVRAEYLVGSYSNGRDLPDDPAMLVARARGYELELGPAALPGGDLLLMNGTDHQFPQPWLGRVVAEANDVQDEYEFVVTSLAEYLPTQPSEGLATWRGELRSGARANVLMGVASNRVDVHRACAAAERALERRAEPLGALFLPLDDYPHAFLDLAWQQLVLDSAHDSSCACSADAVVEEVLVRYRSAREIAEALAREVMHRIGTETDAPAGSSVVVNTAPHARGGLVEVNVPGSGPLHFVGTDGDTCPTQVLAETGGEIFRARVRGLDGRWVLDLMRGPEFGGTRIARHERSATADDEIELVLHGARPEDPVVDLQPLRDELLELTRHDVHITVRVMLPPVRRVLLHVSGVPGLGWSTFTPVEGAGPAGAVVVSETKMANTHLGVEVEHDGTLTITTADGVRVSGLNRYVDGGDGGDTYNYSPPEVDHVVDVPEQVTCEVLEAGPLRGRLLVRSVYEWPAYAIGDARSCSQRADTSNPIEVRTTLELRHDERFLRVTTELDNQCRDHRLRAHFPLPAPVDGSDAECAFAVVHRGLDAEGGPTELGLPTFVSRRFVDCSDGTTGLALLHDGLLEYEVVDGGGELALTLLRATGYLSRAAPALRPNPAGPLDALDGPQLQGPHVVEYAVLVHQGDWRAARLHARADEFLLPLERARVAGLAGAPRPPTGRTVTVHDAVVSAVLRENDEIAVRVHNASPEPTTATVELGDRLANGWTVDLLGRPDVAFAGSVELRAWEIATLRLGR